MNKYQVKQDRGQMNKQTKGGGSSFTRKMGHLKKLLTSKRRLNLHTTNFHLVGGVKKDSTPQESFNI